MNLSNETAGWICAALGGLIVGAFVGKRESLAREVGRVEGYAQANIDRLENEEKQGGK